MSFKCSLLGHRYGDTEVRRDREQDGTELVETKQELKMCLRCGKELVVSETTEVKTVRTPAEGDEQSATAAGTGETPTPESTPAAGAVAGPAGRAGEADGGVAANPGAEPGPRDARERLTGSSSAVASPAVDAEANADADVGADADEAPPARTDDAVFIGEDGEERPAEWPPDGEGETPDGDWEPDIDPDPDRDTTRRVESSGAGLTVPEGEFHCPECEFSTAVEASSLREGDFCPECHRGALEHRSL